MRYDSVQTGDRIVRNLEPDDRQSDLPGSWLRGCADGSQSGRGLRSDSSAFARTLNPSSMIGVIVIAVLVMVLMGKM